MRKDEKNAIEITLKCLLRVSFGEDVQNEHRCDRRQSNNQINAKYCHFRQARFVKELFEQINAGYHCKPECQDQGNATGHVCWHNIDRSLKQLKNERAARYTHAVDREIPYECNTPIQQSGHAAQLLLMFLTVDSFVDLRCKKSYEKEKIAINSHMLKMLTDKRKCE